MFIADDGLLKPYLDAVKSARAARLSAEKAYLAHSDDEAKSALKRADAAYLKACEELANQVILE